MTNRTFIVLMSLAVFIATSWPGAAAKAFAVDPPKYGDRQKAEAYRKKQIKSEIAEDRASGCKYGKDKVTGKCYEPREGQFYRDPETGEVKVKRIEKVNLPWNK